MPETGRPQAKPGKDYRIYVGAFPDGALGEQIQALRLKYDPITAQICPPHVTLAGTYWRGGPATAENEAEAIRRLEILPGILQPFELVLNGVRTFPGQRPVVYLGVKVNNGLIEARNLLLSVLGIDSRREFTPHLTLAMRLPWDQSWAMVNELAASPWNTSSFTAPIASLQLMQRSPNEKTWRCIYRLNLSGG